MGLCAAHSYDQLVDVAARIHAPRPILLDSQRKLKPVIERPRSNDCLTHRKEEFALMHADRLERLTGDHCEVRMYGPGLYKIIRRDATGKRVLSSSF